MAAEPQNTTVSVDGRSLKLSNLDKVLFPATETTKGEVLHYYARIAPVLLPHLTRRPVTRIRWPEGVSNQSFFEKNLPSGAPAWLPSVRLPAPGSRADRETITYPLVEDVATLTYLVNLASLELHVPQWQVDEDATPLPPNRLVIDLDPGSPAGLHECARVALLVRERLDGLGLRSAPVTSGSKGMQLYAQLSGAESSDEVRDRARELAQDLTRSHPELVLWKMTKSLRPGKVLLDWSQNVAAKTTISPYSVRGREAPRVAAPRSWAEVERGAEEPTALRQLEFDEVLDRVEADGDLFADLLGAGS
ncbi:MAG TPA: non-homologous end-joining DNA ligase [Segeticoccus sp.]|nr:non-homologous end-joining DNA ligase [Segeticoccus sp.]